MLIKAVKSVKVKAYLIIGMISSRGLPSENQTPTRKVYMLYELEPSVELTGGAWYTDQELDVEFIDQLSNQLYRFIVSKVALLSSKGFFYIDN